MRRFGIKTLVCSLLLILAMPLPAFAAEESDGLENVVFHTEYVDPIGEETLKSGVRALWRVTEPHLKEQGFSAFPKAHIWGFSTPQDAARNTPQGAGFWANSSGYAEPGVAYIRIRPGTSKDVTTSHEVMHVVQYALSGSDDIGSRCIAEGAAVWYSWKARGETSLKNLMRSLENFNSEDRILDVSEEMEKQLIEYGYEPNPLPAFSELSTGHQWEVKRAEHGTRVYSLCTLAFDMLIQTGGGEEAYFKYMSELRRSDWRTAFNRSFSEDLETFQERFKIYRENWFEDYRFPREIKHDRFIDELLSCKRSGLWAQKVCIR